MRKSILSAIVCAAVGFGVAPPTEAASVRISGVVSWGPGTPGTLFSAPGATSTFSFFLPDPISSNPTTQATGFSYTTNGREVTDPLLPTFVTVEFFTADFAGLFDMTVIIGDLVDEVVSLYGPDIGTSLTIDTGTFSAAAGVQLDPATGSGTVEVSALGRGETAFGAGAVPVALGRGVTGFGAGAVPEPSTWVMMALGFAALAFAGYRSSRKAAMVT
jgi:hypothetical protein